MYADCSSIPIVRKGIDFQPLLYGHLVARKDYISMVMLGAKLEPSGLAAGSDP
jgi:hypothetical protein